jgi:phosphoribosylglycinamide formyltransferase-1
MKKKIAILASGSGTNAENIIKHFSKSKNINISLILSNNKNAYVLERAKKYNIPAFVFSKNELNQDFIKNLLFSFSIDYIVLAGFLLLIPEKIISTYRNRIINIHPALLPKYGGKGMYGDNVHKSVIENKEDKSGITIHFVNEKYDEGQIIFQDFCKVEQFDTIDSLAKKIHQLEYENFPKEIEKVILSKKE